MPGTTSTTVVSAADAISTSAWPTPTVSTRMTSSPAAVRTLIACGAAAASPPSCPRLPIDLMNTPSSVACSCIRTRSPSSAPPVNGEDGSTASTATRFPRARNARTSALVTVDLPAPGAPVRPITRVPAAAGFKSLTTERRRGSPFSAHEITPGERALVPRLNLAGQVLRVERYGVQRAALSSSAEPCPPPPHSAAAPSPPPRRRSS